MTQTIYLTYDGEVFRPEQPVDLPPQTRIRVVIESPPKVMGAGFLDTAESLNLDGPRDWSSRLEDYLYPRPNAE